MIKSCLIIHEDIDISKSKKVIALIKRTNDTYIPKKSKIILSVENVEQFLTDAPDLHYLLMKVVLVFGLNGACRRSEFYNIMTTDIVDDGSVAVITLHNTKTKKDRLFTVSNLFTINGYHLYKTYANLRPRHVTSKRFFLYHRGGKCTSQIVGLKTFGLIPSKIAMYLGLPDSRFYTGHYLRRTSATFLADSGVRLSTLKRHGG